MTDHYGFESEPQAQAPSGKQSAASKVAAGLHDIHEHFHPGHTHKPEPLPADYQQKSARDKQDLLWKRVQKDAYTAKNLPTNAWPAEIARDLFNPERAVKTFTHVADEVPEGRKKLSHQFGVVGKVQLQIFENSPYSGVFDNPGGIGLARLTWAKFDEPTRVTPNMAIKILIDGKPSVNFHTMPNLDGQGSDRNFFLQAAFTNPIPKAIPIPLQVALSKAFATALTLLPPPAEQNPEDENTLGLYEQASVTTAGKPVPEAVAPYKIAFVPNPALRASQAGHDDQDFRIPLSTIPENTVLFDVVAYRQKGDTVGQFIGRLVSRSQFVASPYGDEVLFFQHARKRWQA